MPESKPPPVAFAVKVMDAGSVGVQLPKDAVGVGMPFASTVKVLGCVGINSALLTLVIAGARVLVIVTVATAESSEPSLALKVKLSAAVAAALGV